MLGFVPLILAAAVWPRLWPLVPKTAEFLGLLIISQPIIAGCLALGAAGMGSFATNASAMVIEGGDRIVLLAARTPTSGSGPTGVMLTSAVIFVMTALAPAFVGRTYFAHVSPHMHSYGKAWVQRATNRATRHGRRVTAEVMKARVIGPSKTRTAAKMVGITSPVAGATLAALSGVAPGRVLPGMAPELAQGNVQGSPPPDKPIFVRSHYRALPTRQEDKPVNRVIVLPEGVRNPRPKGAEGGEPDGGE